jgi:LacI family transcriptional regulator
MTIKEIAAESGYGVGTVSRVLNNNPNVSQEARDAVMAVILAHDYQPNANARHLKLQARQGISIIIKGTQNTLLSDILEHMQLLIEQAGYVCMASYIDQDDDEIALAEKISAEKKPMGIAFLGANVEGKEKRIKALGVPCLLVTVGASHLNVSNLSSISVDDEAAAEAMTEYLYKKGHRNIGVIAGNPQLSRPSLLRITGVQSAFLRHGLMLDLHRQVEFARYSLQGGYDAAVRLLQDFPEMTAIFASSDIMALGAIRALYDKGLRCPEDISVCGFDGIELSRYSHPKLTTIVQNTATIAGHGVDILLRCIEKNADSSHEVVAFGFQEGDSVRDLCFPASNGSEAGDTEPETAGSRQTAGSGMAYVEKPVLHSV